MKTPNVGVYQCLYCGSVVEQELQRLPPFCCGIEMSNASECTALQGELLVPLPVAHHWAKTVGSRLAECQPKLQTDVNTQRA